MHSVHDPIVRYGAEQLGQPGVGDLAILGTKAEWQALLEGRDKAKAATPQTQGVWVGWQGGRLYTGDGVHLLRVQLEAASLHLDAKCYASALLIEAAKQAAAKDLVGLARVRDGEVVAVVGTGDATTFDGHVVAHLGAWAVQWVNGPALNESMLACMVPPAAMLYTETPSVTGYPLRAADFTLAAKVAKATKSKLVTTTTATTQAEPHRWDFTSERGCTWTLVTMGAR